MLEAGTDGVYRNCPLNFQMTSDRDQGAMGRAPSRCATDTEDKVSRACMVLLYLTHTHYLFLFCPHSTLLSVLELKGSLGPVSKKGLQLIILLIFPSPLSSQYVRAHS